MIILLYIPSCPRQAALLCNFLKCSLSCRVGEQLKQRISGMPERKSILSEHSLLSHSLHIRRHIVFLWISVQQVAGLAVGRKIISLCAFNLWLGTRIHMVGYKTAQCSCDVVRNVTFLLATQKLAKTTERHGFKNCFYYLSPKFQNVFSFL